MVFPLSHNPGCVCTLDIAIYYHICAVVEGNITFTECVLKNGKMEDTLAGPHVWEKKMRIYSIVKISSSPRYFIHKVFLLKEYSLTCWPALLVPWTHWPLSPLSFPFLFLMKAGLLRINVVKWKVGTYIYNQMAIKTIDKVEWKHYDMLRYSVLLFLFLVFDLLGLSIGKNLLWLSLI